MKIRVPANVVLASLMSIKLELPKSASLATPLEVINIFSGLMSL